MLMVPVCAVTRSTEKKKRNRTGDVLLNISRDCRERGWKALYKISASYQFEFKAGAFSYIIYDGACHGGGGEHEAFQCR